MNESRIDCLLCGNPTASMVYEAFQGFQEPLTFKIYHCKNCNTAFSIPRVETESLYETIYKNGEMVPEYNRYWHYAKIVKKIKKPLEYLTKKESVYWSIKEALAVKVKDKKASKILEIGSGLGYLTYSLIKDNYDAIGLDISQVAVKQAIDNFGNHFVCADLFEFAPQHIESFDFVILTEVIEHIENPLDFIETIISLLKPNGQAIITTPNKSLYPKEAIWASTSPPVHLWWFSEESMIFIAKRLKIKISFVDFSNYFSKNYFGIDMKPICEKRNPQFTFNSNGELISPIAYKTGNTIKLYLFSIAKKIPYLKKVYFKFKQLLNPDIIQFRNNGPTLAIILKKM
jgi:SAM-dependent methyltransferase